MKVNPIKRFLINRRKKKIWLWHRTEAKNLERIKKKGIKPGKLSGLAADDPRVEIINRIFDKQRPRGVRLSRVNSVFLDIPEVHKMRRAFWGMWATPEQKEEMKQHYARARVNPKKVFVGDMDLVTKAQGILDKQAKETGLEVLSAKDISKKSTEQIKELGKKYWKNIVSLEEFLKKYKWAPIPVGGYKPESGKGPVINNPEVLAKAGKTIKGAKVSKGKV